MQVDLIINCYDKTQKNVLNKIFINKVLKQNKYNFTNVFIVINNVIDKEKVIVKASKLKKEKIINDYFFVENYLPKVLKIVELDRKELSPLLHYTDWAFVSLYISKSNYFVHWDPDIYLDKAYNWIGPCLKIMEQNANILVASPLWSFEKWVREREAIKTDKDFLYSYDFSDQVFLARRGDLLKKIYKFNHIYSLRFPLANLGSTFEKRLDSYMKVKKKMRLINRNVTYIHLDNAGKGYPKGTYSQRIKRIIFMLTIACYSVLFYKNRINELKRVVKLFYDNNIDRN